MNSALIFIAVAAGFNMSANVLLRTIDHGDVAPKLAVYFSWIFITAVALFGLNLMAYTQALKTIPLGVAYPLLVGFSTAGIAIISAVFFGEAMGVAKVLGYVLLVLAIYLITR